MMISWRNLISFIKLSYCRVILLGISSQTHPNDRQGTHDPAQQLNPAIENLIHIGRVFPAHQWRVHLHTHLCWAIAGLRPHGAFNCPRLRSDHRRRCLDHARGGTQHLFWSWRQVDEVWLSHGVATVSSQTRLRHDSRAHAIRGALLRPKAVRKIRHPLRGNLPHLLWRLSASLFALAAQGDGQRPGTLYFQASMQQRGRHCFAVKTYAGCAEGLWCDGACWGDSNWPASPQL